MTSVIIPFEIRSKCGNIVRSHKIIGCGQNRKRAENGINDGALAVLCGEN